MDLSIQMPQKSNWLQTLSFLHVLRAELPLSGQDGAHSPWEEQVLPPHKAATRRNTRSEWKDTK